MTGAGLQNWTRHTQAMSQIIFQLQTKLQKIDVPLVQVKISVKDYLLGSL